MAPTFTPIDPDGLVRVLAERVRHLPGRRVVAVSGADAARPLVVADAVVDALRAAGRPADTVWSHDYVRPASLRLEHGHHDDLSYRSSWFDFEALDREVVTALREHGRWLPRLWDEASDRSARARTVDARDHQVVVVAGPMLLGRVSVFDLTVDLALSRAALLRLTPADDRWTIDALLGHEREVDTAPDVLVRYDHPDRPAYR